MDSQPVFSQPFIKDQIIHSHQSRQSDSSSEPSFLKLSQKNSLELRCPAEHNLFQEMALRLKALQNKQKIKLNDITNQIKKYEQSMNLQDSISKEGKQHLQVTYRKLKPNLYQLQPFQPENFQMDEHSYVKYGPSPAQKEEYSCLARSKATELKQSKARQAPQEKKASRLAIIQPQYLSPLRLSQRGISTSRTKRKSTVSSWKDQTKRVRVYEQILSMYSITKLLAMQA